MANGGARKIVRRLGAEMAPANVRRRAMRDVWAEEDKRRQRSREFDRPGRKRSR